MRCIFGTRKCSRQKFLQVLLIGNHQATILGKLCITCLSLTEGNLHSSKTRSMLCKASFTPLHAPNIPFTISWESRSCPCCVLLGGHLPGSTTVTEECFLIGLCWFHLGPGKRRPQFPSWSWAGWDGKLYHHLMFASGWECRLDECKVWIEGEGESLHKFPSQHEKLYDFLSQSDGRDRFIRIETKTLCCKISSTPLNEVFPLRFRKRAHLKMFLKDGIFLFMDYYYLDTEIESW